MPRLPPPAGAGSFFDPQWTSVMAENGMRSLHSALFILTRSACDSSMEAQTSMNADWRYRGFGAALVSTAVGSVAERVGMSHREAFMAFVLVLVGLQMVAGNKPLE
jgi:hypothetical protein